MSVLDSLDWQAVRAQYETREQTHAELMTLQQLGKVPEFVSLLLGIRDPSGNYSAAEHHIGPKIIAENPKVESRLWSIATQFQEATSGHDIPILIRQAQIKYFQIGVGSEASCMVNPQVCWVANVRTIWTHLVHKHADNFSKADMELKLYRESDVDSEMAYQMWRALHAELAGTVTRISEQGAALATKAGITPGSIRYLWADAIANQLYTDRHG